MKSWSLLFACNLMWALQFTCIKLVEDQVGPMFTVWGPMFIATLLLYPLVRAERVEPVARAHSRASNFRLYGALIVLGVFPGQMLLTWGTRWTLASNAALISLTLPVCTAVMAFLFLGERMTRLRWFSFGLAIAGVAMCAGRDLAGLEFSRVNFFGNFLILLGNLGSAFYNSYGKKALERHSPLRMLFYTYVGMLALMLPFVIVQERDLFARLPHFTVQTWVGLGLLAFFHNFLSMVLFLKALKVLHAIQAALSNYLISAFGVPIAVIWLGERFTPMGVAGGLLVLVSTLLITLREEFRRVPVPA
jgi:drug/metabolite transporter (DMT)-like permease